MGKREIIPYNPKLKPLAKALRNNMTFPEVILWKHLKGRQMMGYHFNRQRPLDNYIVDFYCKDLKLAIEVDGKTHEFPEVQVKDEEKQKILERWGVHFLRFSNYEIKNDFQNVLKTIENWILDYEESLST